MMSRAVNVNTWPQASSGNRDSGIWSRPTARLLGCKPRRRFKKLERRSPAIAVVATTKPIFNVRPSSGAQADVMKIETRIPRTVFEAPKSGRPSTNLMFPSRGHEQEVPKIFLATTGEPFAMVSRIRSCKTVKYCMQMPHHRMNRASGDDREAGPMCLQLIQYAILRIYA